MLFRSGIAEETVAQHIRTACERYGVNKRMTLVIYAMIDGTLTVSDVCPWLHPPFPG